MAQFRAHGLLYLLLWAGGKAEYHSRLESVTEVAILHDNKAERTQQRMRDKIHLYRAGLQ